MKRIITLMLILLNLVSYAQIRSIKNSPPLAEVSAITVGMSEERLARIDSLFNQSIKLNKIPGASVLVARNGKIVYYKAFGMSNNETKQPLKRDDIFRIASQTKAITSTAIMMLWEEGKFQLDDPISMYIPEFKNMFILDSLNVKDSSYTCKPAKNPITIRHLLTHTSGIGYGIIDDKNFRKIYQKAGIVDVFTTKNVTIKDNILKLAKLPLHHEPGAKFTYSEGLDVLIYLVEIISGMPADKFFKEKIFDPLDMKDTYFYLPDSKKNRLVTPQTYKDGKWIKYTNKYYDVDYPIKGAKTFFSGGAGLSSTSRDYATFLQMYLNKGELNGVRLLSRTTVQFMMENQVGDLFFEPGSYFGLAFQVLNQKGEAMGGRGSVGTFEWGGYFYTKYFADPKEGIIGILMKQIQGSSTDDTENKFKALVFQAIDD